MVPVFRAYYTSTLGAKFLPFLWADHQSIFLHKFFLLSFFFFGCNMGNLQLRTLYHHLKTKLKERKSFVASIYIKFFSEVIYFFYLKKIILLWKSFFPPLFQNITANRPFTSFTCSSLTDNQVTTRDTFIIVSGVGERAYK